MSTDKNGSNSRERRHFSPQQKLAIVKEHLVDGVPISDLCDRHHIQPAQFYLWQKQFFENGTAAFTQTGKRRQTEADAKDKKIAALEDKLQRKNEVLAELMEEHVQLKKALGGP